MERRSCSASGAPVRHYRCKECEALFATETLDERPMPNSVFCVFCGADAKAFDSLHGIEAIRLSPSRAERRAARGVAAA